MFKNVASWDAPDATSFVIHMKQPQPTFIELISSFSVPSSSSGGIQGRSGDAVAYRRTGPWQLVDFTPGAK